MVGHLPFRQKHIQSLKPKLILLQVSRFSLDEIKLYPSHYLLRLGWS
jgi:hypothetical protein